MFGRQKKSSTGKSQKTSFLAELTERKRRTTGQTAVLSPWVKMLISGGLIFFALLGLVFGGAGFFYRIYFSRNDLFSLPDLSYVIIEGGGASMSEELILEYLGIEKGMNLFAFDTQGAYQRFLQHAPNIKSVSIQCILPNRMVVKLTEREPVARLSSYGFAVDDEGVIFIRRNIGGLPVITGAENFSRIEPGGRITGYSFAAIRLAVAATQRKYSFRIQTIDASKPDYLLLTMYDHRQAKIAWIGMDDPNKDTLSRLNRQLSELNMAYASELGRNKLMFNATVPGRVAAE